MCRERIPASLVPSPSDPLPLVPREVTASSLATLLAVALTTCGLAAQDSIPTPERVVVPPGTEFRAGALHRWIFGDGYRDLWSLEARLDVLDLRHHAGGLHPVGRLDDLPFRSLEFRSEAGDVYRFRPVSFDPRLGFDARLRASLAEDVLRDQLSSTLPFADPVVQRLLAAGGLPHADGELVVLPDDEALGEFREEFGGAVGYLGRRVVPTRGAEGSSSGDGTAPTVLGSLELVERLRRDPRASVDQRAFLRARYMDVLVGDWNRRPDVWLWVGHPDRVDGGDVVVFEPRPAPRAWAFARLDGLLQPLISLEYPQFTGFARDYPSVEDASWSALGLDGALLTELDSADFVAVAEELAGRLGDDVIEDAVRRLPPAHYRRVGDELESALVRRRDRLPEFARRYHALLARWVDVDGTEFADLVRIERSSEGRTTITITPSVDGLPDGTPWYRRTFDPSWTEEIRIHAHGGYDRVVIEGTASRQAIPIRILGGSGGNRIDDRTSGLGVWVHDPDRDDDVRLGTHAVLDHVDWFAPDDPAAELDGTRLRNWGVQWSILPTVDANVDDGFVPGVVAERYGHGARRYPWADRLEFRASIGTARWRPNLAAAYLTRTFAGIARGEFRASWSGARADRFHGFGNDTQAPREDRRYRAWRRESMLSAAIRLDPSEATGFSLGARYRRLDPEENPGTLVEEVSPYGYGDFRHFEVVGTATLDHRDDEDRPRGGYRLEMTATGNPPWLDVREWYGSIGATASGYLTLGLLPLAPTLATRLSARRVLGTAPYFGLTSIGGDGLLRGYRNQRFLGDTSLIGSAELRGSPIDFEVLIKGELGLLTLVDVGRVWLDGASPGGWHAAVGAGFWTRLMERYTGSLAVAKGERWTLHGALRMPF